MKIFFGANDLIKQHKNQMRWFAKQFHQDEGLFSQYSIVLFGELYGKGVQKEINYGDGKYFRVFDIAIQLEHKDYLEFFLHKISNNSVCMSLDLLLPDHY